MFIQVIEIQHDVKKSDIDDCPMEQGCNLNGILINVDKIVTVEEGKEITFPSVPSILLDKKYLVSDSDCGKKIFPTINIKMEENFHIRIIGDASRIIFELNSGIDKIMDKIIMKIRQHFPNGKGLTR